MDSSLYRDESVGVFVHFFVRFITLNNKIPQILPQKNSQNSQNITKVSVDGITFLYTFHGFKSGR
jgi:hypothetical protein